MKNSSLHCHSTHLLFFDWSILVCNTFCCSDHNDWVFHFHFKDKYGDNESQLQIPDLHFKVSVHKFQFAMEMIHRSGLTVLSSSYNL